MPCSTRCRRRRGGCWPRPALAERPPPAAGSGQDRLSPRLGAYGDTLARTPTLDRLAKASVRYTHAFTTAPVCAPSRAAIITGMHQNAIGAQHMRTTEDRVPELPGPYLAVPPFYMTEWNDYPFVQPENDQPAHATYVAKKFYWALMHATRLVKIHFFNYADGDTSQDVAQRGTQAQPPGQRHRHNGGQQVDEGL